MSQFQVKNPDYVQRCHEVVAKQPLMRTLGAKLVRVEPGFGEMHLPFREDLTQQNGFLHAGMVATLADNAGGCAALSLLPPGWDVLAVEFKINLMAPAKGELAIARARVLRAGRTLAVCAVDVFVVQDGREKHCAAMQQTIFCAPPQAEK